MKRRLSSIILLGLLSFSCASAGPTIYIPPQLRNAKDSSNEKPHLTISVLPATMLQWTTVSAVVKIKGGPITEDFYCKTISWDWGDGNISKELEDCDPFEAGVKIKSLFVKIHEYRDAGEFKVTFRLGTHTIATTVIVYSALPNEDL